MRLQESCKVRRQSGTSIHDIDVLMLSFVPSYHSRTYTSRNLPENPTAMSTPHSQHICESALGHILLRTAWTFQAIAAFPTFFILGFLAAVNLFNTFESLYEFVTYFITSILAGAIMFLVLVQRSLLSRRQKRDLVASRSANRAENLQTLQFEIAKAVLATALWVWLFCDALFGPQSHYDNTRNIRIRVAAIAVFLLL